MMRVTFCACTWLFVAATAAAVAADSSGSSHDKGEAPWTGDAWKGETHADALHADLLEQMQQLLGEIAEGLPSTAADGTGNPFTGPHRDLHATPASGFGGAGTAGRSPALPLQIPSGLRALLRNQVMPDNVARIFSVRSRQQQRQRQQGGGDPLGGASPDGNYADYAAFNLTQLMRKGPGFDQKKDNPGAAAIQEAIDAATLGVVSSSLNLVAAIIFTVSGSLSTLASSLGIIVANWARLSGRISLGFNSYAFFQVLYAGRNAQIDGSDYLGDAAKYIKLYNQLQAELRTGELSADVQSQMAQIAMARNLLEAVVANVAAT